MPVYFSGIVLILILYHLDYSLICFTVKSLNVGIGGSGLSFLDFNRIHGLWLIKVNKAMRHWIQYCIGCHK